MTNERKAQLLDILVSWVAMHDKDFVRSAVYIMGLTPNEIEELELKDYIE